MTREHLQNEINTKITALAVAQANNVPVRYVYKKCKEYGIKSIGCSLNGGGAKGKIDLTGHVYNKLTVLKEVPIDICKSNSRKWLCKCSCGKEVEVLGKSLRTGGTQSCGCYHKDVMWKGYGELSLSYWSSVKRAAEERNIELTISMEYVWDLFLKQNKKCRFSGVELNFREHINYPNYRTQTASLDRIDNSKGYIEGNVQWVHKKVNELRGKFPVEEFKMWCKLISKNLEEIEK